MRSGLHVRRELSFDKAGVMRNGPNRRWHGRDSVPLATSVVCGCAGVDDFICSQLVPYCPKAPQPAGTGAVGTGAVKEDL